MFEMIIRFGIPALGILLALGIANLIFKRKYPVKKWHGWVGIVVSLGMIFVVVRFLQKTSFGGPVMIAGMILGVFSFAIYKAAQRLEKERMGETQSGKTG